MFATSISQSTNVAHLSSCKGLRFLSSVECRFWRTDSAHVLLGENLLISCVSVSSVFVFLCILVSTFPMWALPPAVLLNSLISSRSSSVDDLRVST